MHRFTPEAIDEHSTPSPHPNTTSMQHKKLTKTKEAMWQFVGNLSYYWKSAASSIAILATAAWYKSFHAPQSSITSLLPRGLRSSYVFGIDVQVSFLNQSVFTLLLVALVVRLELHKFARCIPYCGRCVYTYVLSNIIMMYTRRCAKHCNAYFPKFLTRNKVMLQHFQSSRIYGRVRGGNKKNLTQM